MRAIGPNVPATMRAIWIVIAILAALILGLIIFQAFRQYKKPSVPENQQGQALGIAEHRQLRRAAEI